MERGRCVRETHSCRKRMETSKVAPPHISMEKASFSACDV